VNQHQGSARGTMKFGERIKSEEAACLSDGNRIELSGHFLNYDLLKQMIEPIEASACKDKKEHQQAFVLALSREIHQVIVIFFRVNLSKNCRVCTRIFLVSHGP